VAFAPEGGCPRRALGSLSKQPIAPVPPALATATLKSTGQAPAMGASKMGGWSPKRSQDSFARARAEERKDPGIELTL
jgi:hypothetical protein